MIRLYESIDEAIQREIIEPIENGAVSDVASEFDIDAIAEAVLEGQTDENGRYYIAPKEDVDFWDVVEKAAYDRGIDLDSEGRDMREVLGVMEPADGPARVNER